ncbi:MAG: PEP/pyruvate-binding domain-containing protein [Ardenticatenales bacterium]
MNSADGRSGAQAPSGRPVVPSILEPDLEAIVEAYDFQTSQLQTLLSYRVRRVLLVASLYDSYTLSEGAHLAELIVTTYQSLSLEGPPEITRVSTRARALEVLASRPFDLVISIAAVNDLGASEFGIQAKSIYPAVPVFIMAYDMRELFGIPGGPGAIPNVDGALLWRGDVRLFLAIIRLVEDRRNAEHDARVGGVRSIILVEDSIPFISSYLPLVFSALTRQTDQLIAESLNLDQRLLRRRLRPRLRLATTFEEGWALYQASQDHVLAVISDVRFPRGGVDDNEAGLKLLRQIRAVDAETPLLLQSSQDRFAAAAKTLGAAFVNKNSPTLLTDFNDFMLDRLGFGDFVFRDPDGAEVARAADVDALLRVLPTIPDDVLVGHAQRNGFSNWLMARTEFALASELRTLHVDDFPTTGDMRLFLIDRLQQIRDAQRSGQVVDFAAARADARDTFVRIGSGSLGGKGRGLAFTFDLLSRGDIARDLPRIRLFVPTTAVLATDVFDAFVGPDLQSFALRESDDHAILSRFLDTALPRHVSADLAAFLERADQPLAVRSSSLLEDSHHLPAAGVYPTHMLPNNAATPQARLAALEAAIKHIYAATYFTAAKAYFAATPNRVEDEKMAVVIMQIVGDRHGDVVYPHFSGVAQSHNFYPVRAMKAEEGIATVALGLGKTVVDGGRAVRFSPAHPEWLPQMSVPEDILANAQRTFWALDVTRPASFHTPEPESALVELGLADAERHDTLWPVASVYVPDNDAVYDGLSRPGVRLVTFAPILKHHLLPLCETLQRLLQLGTLGMSGPVEVEFAVCLRPSPAPHEFAFLQIRPLVLGTAAQAIDLTAIAPEDAFIAGSQALGVGRTIEVADIVSVRRDVFDRQHTPDIALEVAAINAELVAAGRPYLLIGPGRWGTADRWLGIPVAWRDIAGARVIVECDLAGIPVEPSQGTHFFHNMTSLGIGYFTASERHGAHIDWTWLDDQPVGRETTWVRHHRLAEPLEVLIDVRSGEGAVLKQPTSPPDED